jgi:hypothetical protein
MRVQRTSDEPRIANPNFPQVGTDPSNDDPPWSPIVDPPWQSALVGPRCRPIFPQYFGKVPVGLRRKFRLQPDPPQPCAGISRAVGDSSVDEAVHMNSAAIRPAFFIIPDRTHGCPSEVQCNSLEIPASTVETASNVSARQPHSAISAETVADEHIPFHSNSVSAQGTTGSDISLRRVDRGSAHAA